jgi:hypothetical protein
MKHWGASFPLSGVGGHLLSGRLSSLPVKRFSNRRFFARPKQFHGTGKFRKPAGWKTCPTSLTGISV